jgi:hypothetical protein
MTSQLLDRAVRFSPLVAVPFAFGAIHHVMAVVSPDASDTSSATRHLVFVGINLFFCAAFALRARWTIFPATLLALQQIVSHGSAFLEARRVGVFDSQSFAVLVFLPVVLIAAFALLKKRRSTERA